MIMKRLIAAIALCLPLCMMAQSNWERPDDGSSKQQEPKKEKKEKPQKDNGDAQYIMPDAVPVVDGKVSWTTDIEVHESSAQQNYDLMLAFLTKMVKESNQLPESNVSLVNKTERKIAASIREWLVFSSSFISIDRTEFHYTLLAECFDNHVTVTLNRIAYHYPEQQNKVTIYKAEELITDNKALNKAHTKLIRPGSKFRRKTIDRKDELFARMAEYLQNGGEQE